MTRLISLLGPNSETTTKPGGSNLYSTLRSMNRVCSDLNVAEALVFLDFDKNPKFEIGVQAKKKPITLVRQEPKVIRPQNYRADYLHQVDQIIDVGRPPTASTNRINWPQDWNLEHLSRSIEFEHQRSNRVAVINANKLSFVRGELYSLRRKASQVSPEIDVWGAGWDLTNTSKAFIAKAELQIPIRHGFGISPTAIAGWFGKPRSYMGISESKLQTLSGYNYSLVIENSLEFLTEKLFDSLFSGTLPIYVGPKLSEFEIPGFVAVTAEPDLGSVLEAIDAAKQVDLTKWRNQVLNWLNSQVVKRSWSSEFVMQDLVQKIDAVNS